MTSLRKAGVEATPGRIWITRENQFPPGFFSISEICKVPRDTGLSSFLWNGEALITTSCNSKSLGVIRTSIKKVFALVTWKSSVTLGFKTYCGNRQPDKSRLRPGKNKIAVKVRRGADGSFENYNVGKRYGFIILASTDPPLDCTLLRYH